MLLGEERRERAATCIAVVMSSTKCSTFPINRGTTVITIVGGGGSTCYWDNGRLLSQPARAKRRWIVDRRMWKETDNYVLLTLTGFSSIQTWEEGQEG